MNKTVKYILFVFSILVAAGAMGFIVKFMFRSFETALTIYWVTIGISVAITYLVTKNKYKTLAKIAVELRKGRVNAVCVNDAKDEKKLNFIYFYSVNDEKEILSITCIDCPHTFSKMMSNYDLKNKYKEMVDFLNAGDDYLISGGKFVVVDQSYDEFFDKSARRYILEDY